MDELVNEIEDAMTFLRERAKRDRDTGLRSLHLYLVILLGKVRKELSREGGKAS